MVNEALQCWQTGDVLSGTHSGGSAMEINCDSVKDIDLLLFASTTFVQR